MTVTTRSSRTKEPCLETKNVRIEAHRIPNYSVPGAGRAKPETGLVTGKSHVHVWAIMSGDGGRDEIRCVTCDGVLARMQELVVRAVKRVAANPMDPGVLPKLGEGDETPDFLVERARDIASRSRFINLVYRHRSGGRLYQGNFQDATDVQALDKAGIKVVVFAAYEKNYVHLPDRFDVIRARLDDSFFIGKEAEVRISALRQEGLEAHDLLPLAWSPNPL